LPPGPIFHLQRAHEAEHEIGAFRAWAGYKDYGCDAATDGLVLFQHVLSFAPSEAAGRTGVHCHLAHVHIILPSSGRGAFSYDGVVTEAVPGSVIVQHGGTVHDQFLYSYAAASADENCKTPVTIDPPAPDAPLQSFSFLELFVPRTIADVELVPPAAVTPEDQATAWDHPYHAPGARFALQGASDPGAAWRPVAGLPDLQVRDAETWAPTNRLVATQILRAATEGPAAGDAIPLEVPGETGGLEVLLVVQGSVGFEAPDGTPLKLKTGDCLTCTAGLAGAPEAPSTDLRLLRFFVSSRAEALYERSREEIERLEALGPGIARRREIRPAGDSRPVNFLSDPSA
jgi:quercetin dioxygenase-like cupin family protein